LYFLQNYCFAGKTQERYRQQMIQPSTLSCQT
jgi:hypothetical protein